MKKKTVSYKKDLKRVTTRGHSQRMKPEPMPKGEEEMESAVVQELAELPGIGTAITVRAAKAHLSGLLAQVARGREVVITSDGLPKARLVPMGATSGRQPFQGTREHLKSMPPWRGGRTADEIVREDRDGRG